MARGFDVIVVGGGVGGLAAATLVARTGRRVLLLERGVLGGRARSKEKEGFILNQGPHALYRGGPAEKTLRTLGVALPDKIVATKLSLAMRDDRLFTLPTGVLSLVSSSLLTSRAKLTFARLLATIGSIDVEALMTVTVEAWLTRLSSDPSVRAVLEALIRVATYSNAPETVSAGVAIGQIRAVAQGGVTYLDGGWQSLVDGVAALAREAGVEIRTHVPVTRVVVDGGVVRGVEIEGGESAAATVVVTATSPRVVASLLPELEAARSWAASAQPLMMATLDLGLRRLPKPERIFTLGIDRPLYFSVHSAHAKLAKDDEVMMHVARYFAPGEVADHSTVLAELESFVDRIQPGWREETRLRRYLPEVTVSHWLPRASEGGLAARPTAKVAGVRGLYLVGDWVGAHGHLLDASLASASEVAHTIDVEPRGAMLGRVRAELHA